MDMDFDFGAILQVFRAEATETLASVEDALLAMEAAPGDAALLDAVFRGIHTLKGDASNLGFPAVAEFAHVTEDLLDRLREHELSVTPPRLELLLAAVDVLRAAVPASLDGADELDGPARALQARIAAAAAEPSDTAAPSAREVDAAAADAAGASAEGAAAPADRPADAERARIRTLRVDVEKLDRTLDLVGEIAIARGRLTQMLEEGRPAAEVLAVHREADRLHMDLQEVVMKLRMVPLGPMVRPYHRTVRDVAHVCGKQARLVVEGADVEVDTSIVEQLREPLTHLVRNAVDHGLETPEARAEAGKDPEGTVTFSARHEAGSVVIQMRDDGAGMNRARIAARARAAGLHPDPERLADAELFRMVFEPGFSTAEAVTEISGRGVGLDVVRRAVDALRGTLAVESREGEGTCITLRLPLTLAVIEGFSVGVDGETYVMPLDSVVECLELPAERHDGGADGMLNLRGQPLPWLRLRERFCPGAALPRRESVVVVRHGEGRAGLVVDALIGDGQAVIKPLGRLFDGLPGIAGSTILGSGRVALILDVPSLMEDALRAAPAAAAA
ncbi:MAG TPA: chemotaxis protein CheA [Longimicrobium sp.]|uniref:chemotaxis protein CheA n=1 Tax=Longimicrobium sp. TaxID=2029185 RepID=UPI002ED8AAF2